MWCFSATGRNCYLTEQRREIKEIRFGRTSALTIADRVDPKEGTNMCRNRLWKFAVGMALATLVASAKQPPPSLGGQPSGPWSEQPPQPGQPGQPGPQDDGPGRGVARISIMNGEVSIRRGDSGDLIAAGVNAPLVVADRLVTAPNSPAQIQFDWAHMLRTASDTEVRLAELENQRYLIQVPRGTVTFRVLHDARTDAEISTPVVSVRPLKKGT